MHIVTRLFEGVAIGILAVQTVIAYAMGAAFFLLVLMILAAIIF